MGSQNIGVTRFIVTLALSQRYRAKPAASSGCASLCVIWRTGSFPLSHLIEGTELFVFPCSLPVHGIGSDDPPFISGISRLPGTGPERSIDWLVGAHQRAPPAGNRQHLPFWFMPVIVQQAHDNSRRGRGMEARHWGAQHKFLPSKADLTTATDGWVMSQRRDQHRALRIAENIPGDQPGAQFQGDYIGSLPLCKWQNPLPLPLLLEMAVFPDRSASANIFMAPQYCFLVWSLFGLQQK